MNDALVQYFNMPLQWLETGDAELPWKTRDGAFVLRLGDFPDEPLYQLLHNGKVVGSFDDWPPQWEKIKP